MMKRACLLSLLSIAAAVTMSSCGGGGGSAPITVNITTDVSNIETFQTVQFAAAVTGTSNTAVTWQLACNTLPVSVCGTMSASGMYVAPNTVPTLATVNSTDPATLTVTATSQANMNIASIVQFTIDSLNMQPLYRARTARLVRLECGRDLPHSGPGFCFGGTLGSLLTSGRKNFIFSNNHVLGLSDGGAVGQERDATWRYRDELLDGRNDHRRERIEHHKSPEPTDSGISRRRHHRADHPSGQVDTNESILELGALSTVNGVQVPQPAPPASGSGMAATVGQLLAKSGRTTGLTCAKVEAMMYRGSRAV